METFERTKEIMIELDRTPRTQKSSKPDMSTNNQLTTWPLPTLPYSPSQEPTPLEVFMLVYLVLVLPTFTPVNNAN